MRNKATAAAALLVTFSLVATADAAPAATNRARRGAKATTTAKQGAKQGAKKAILAAKVTAAPAGALMATTCDGSAKGAKDPRCGRPSWISGGTLGAGPAIRGTSGFPSIGDGFIDGNRLVVAVEMGSQFDDQGAIFGIDLDSGKRTVLSGKIEDAATGPVVVGSGPELGNVRAVAQAGSSWMAIVSKGSTMPMSIVRIDPTTGARTLVRTLDAGVIPCSGSTAKLIVDPTGFTAAADGTIYAAVGNLSHAVGIVALTGQSCSVVTMSGAGGFESKGSGPSIDSLDHYRSLRVDGGKLWALHGISNSLVTIDLATGNRARVSSGEAATRVGAGDAKLGTKTLALAGGKVWTAGNWAGVGGFNMTEVSTASGLRTAYEGSTGPASNNDEVKGVWAHPSKPLLVVSIDNAIGLYDPATGNSMILSE